MVRLYHNQLCSEFNRLLHLHQLPQIVRAESSIQLNSALASHSEWVNLYFNWRPNLRDEGDNFLIELAIAGNVDAIVTHNIRDLKSGELVFPQLKILTPDVYLEQLR
jgi:predicted nucleic acid-binding protein